MAQPKKGRGRASAIKELGAFPGTQENISVFSGKYGPYVKYAKTNVSLPEGVTPENVTLEKAVELLKGKGATAADAAASDKKEKKAKTPKKAKATSDDAPAGASKSKPTPGKKAPAKKVAAPEMPTPPPAPAKAKAVVRKALR